MKLAIALLAVAVGFLVIVLAALGLDDFALRHQLARERTKMTAAKSELDGKMQSASTQLVLAREETARLTNELSFPIRLIQKKTANGACVIQIFNNSNETVPVSVTYSNTFARKGRSFEFEVMPGFSRDISHLEGWTAREGDWLQLRCPGFQPITRILP
jgi:hypothetical protein